jgi:hypothetical protein
MPIRETIETVPAILTDKVPGYITINLYVNDGTSVSLAATDNGSASQY